MEDTRPFITLTETFTTVTTGATQDVTAFPFTSFCLQATGTGGTPTIWNVVLEGSLDNTNFTTILNHITTTGIGVNAYTGASKFPCLYYRTRVVALTLGAATNISIKTIGMQV